MHHLDAPLKVKHDNNIGKQNTIMKTKVYYGEYTINHWIKLLLSGDIVLPTYQRYFAWEPWQVESFAQNLKNEKFIPPIIIAACRKKDDKGTVETQNYIIDGQQRLTAVLLAALGLYPNPKCKDFLVNDADEIQGGGTKMLWRYEKLFEGITEKNLHNIKEKHGEDKEQYNNLRFETTESFWSAKVGFAYIVPAAEDFEDFKVQQQYYSTLFRDINQQGTKLTKQESRKSLYFLDESLEGWFYPAISHSVKNVRSNTYIDFVKYTSILSLYYQHYKSNYRTNPSEILPSDRKFVWEEFYTDYIYAVTGIDSGKTYEKGQSPIERFGVFEELYADRNYSKNMSIFEKTASDLGLNKGFDSIIDIDVCFFGLVFCTLFLKKQINLDEKDKIVKELNAAIKKFKANEGHTKSPSSKTYLGNRIYRSLRIYQKYAK